MFKKKENKEEELKKRIGELKTLTAEKNPDVEIEGREPVTSTATPTKESAKKEIWTVGEVPTQTQPVIVNTRTDENLDLYLSVARMLNILEEVREAIK